MNIEKADIRFMSCNSLYSEDLEGVRHTKVLPWLSIVQSLEGNYEVALGGGEHERTEEGGFFIAPSGVSQDIIHHLSERSGKIRCRWIFIDAVINHSYRFDSIFLPPLIPPKSVQRELGVIFDEYFNTDSTLLRYSLCYRLLELLVKASDMIKFNFPREITLALDFIAERYADKITVFDLAKISHTSEPNFYAVFKKHLGVSPIDYLNSYRLSIASELLLAGELGIAEVGAAVGIRDPLYFSKIFKKNYHLSPREYRKVHRTER